MIFCNVKNYSIYSHQHHKRLKWKWHVLIPVKVIEKFMVVLILLMDIFLDINKPDKNDTGNVNDYLYGKYYEYGINFQECCGHLSRFVYIYVVSPVSWSDLISFQKC